MGVDRAITDGDHLHTSPASALLPAMCVATTTLGRPSNRWPNGGTLKKAASVANHAGTRTTQFYDRRRDEMNLDEAERIRV